jgi:hypothetical protein
LFSIVHGETYIGSEWILFIIKQYS